MGCVGTQRGDVSLKWIKRFSEAFPELNYSQRDSSVIQMSDFYRLRLFQSRFTDTRSFTLIQVQVLLVFHPLNNQVQLSNLKVSQLINDIDLNLKSLLFPYNYLSVWVLFVSVCSVPSYIYHWWFVCSAPLSPPLCDSGAVKGNNFEHKQMAEALFTVFFLSISCKHPHMHLYKNTLYLK